MLRWALRVVGVVLIVAGGVVLWRFVEEARSQSQAATAETRGWHDLIAAAAGPSTPGTSACESCYLKLTVPRLGRSMVAVDGDWSSLKRSPMVHYRSSPAPGQTGNVLVAFHREFSWPDIDRLGPGDSVTLQARDGTVWAYVVEFVRTVPPSDVSLVQPTTGRNLTLITCTPWLRDYDRMVFRLRLISP